MIKSNFDRFDDFFTRYDTISEGVTILSNFLKCSSYTIHSWRHKKKIPEKKFSLIQKQFEL